MRSGLAVYGTLGFLLLALWAAFPPSAFALTASQVYEQVKDSVVVVKAYDQKGKTVGLGSGVVLQAGEVITNFHVVKGGVRYTVGRGKQATPATLKAGNPDKDLCLLTAPGLGAKPTRLGQAANLKVGEPVYAVGAPQGLELSLSEGIVSQLRGGPPSIIQTTVAISPGSSGGGLFNAEGELVGITTFYLEDSQNLNFAVPAEWIGMADWRKPPVNKVDNWGKKLMAAYPDWQAWLALCRQWTKAEPRNAVAWHYLGISYGLFDRHREAVQAYKSALRLDPDFDESWKNLGNTYVKMGRYLEAVEALNEGLRLKPDCVTWIELGNTYAIMGRHQEAVEALLEGLRLEPDYMIVWMHLKVFYDLPGNRGPALEAVGKLRQYDPQKAQELFNLIMKQ